MHTQNRSFFELNVHLWYRLWAQKPLVSYLSKFDSYCISHNGPLASPPGCAKRGVRWERVVILWNSWWLLIWFIWVGESRHLIELKAKYSSLIWTTLNFIFASDFEPMEFGINFGLLKNGKFLKDLHCGLVKSKSWL